MSQTAITSPYVDYEFYTHVFYGDDISETEFNKFAARGEDLVDVITWNRIPDIPESLMTERLAIAIRKAVCAAAEQYKMLDLYTKGMLKSIEKAGKSGGVASESNDGYAVSYQNVLSGGAGLSAASDAKAAYEREAKVVALQYLADTGLLYRGAGNWHDRLRYATGEAS